MVEGLEAEAIEYAFSKKWVIGTSKEVQNLCEVRNCNTETFKSLNQKKMTFSFYRLRNARKRQKSRNFVK